MLASSLHSKMDVLSSVVVMGLLAFSSLLALMFVGFQLHNETVCRLFIASYHYSFSSQTMVFQVHIVRLASNVVNSRPDWLMLARNFTEDQLEDHDINIDDYVQQVCFSLPSAWLS